MQTPRRRSIYFIGHSVRRCGDLILRRGWLLSCLKRALYCGLVQPEEVAYHLLMK